MAMFGHRTDRHPAWWHIALAVGLVLTGTATLPDPLAAQPASDAGRQPAAAPTADPVRYLDEVFAGVTETTNIVYGVADKYDGTPMNLKLDVYSPTGDTETNRPVLMYIHGGGFAAGGRSEGAGIARLAAKRGYVAVSIDYRVVADAESDLAKLLWAMTAAQHDARAALRWLRANAESLGINPTAIGAIGYSAGAITSLNLAFRPHDPGTSGNPGHASDVQAAVSLAGFANQVTPNAPPTLLFHGTDDPRVLFAWGQATCEDSVAAGNECTLVAIPGATHLLRPYFATIIYPQTWQFLYEKVIPALAPPIRPGGYHPLTPVRVLDTRDGTGVAGGVTTPLPGGASIDLAAAGAGGVPATGVGSVLLNITAVNATTATHVTVWPAGGPRPITSNLNLVPNTVKANLVSVGLGSGGGVSLFNNSGAVHLVADVVGWFDDGTPTTGARLIPVSPNRILDTRNGTGAPTGPLPAGTPLDVAVGGTNGVPPNAAAVVVNLTVTGSSAASHLTAWPSGEAQPWASNINFVAGQTVANLAVVKLGTDGQLRISTNSGSTHVIADMVGYYVATGTRFVPLTPARVLDTRDGTGVPASPLGGGAVITVNLDGVGGLPKAGVAAVAINVTAIGGTSASFLTVFPAATSLPNASTVNFLKGQTVPNLAIVPTGGNGSQISVFNSYGSNGGVHVIGDLVGYFT